MSATRIIGLLALLLSANLEPLSMAVEQSLSENTLQTVSTADHLSSFQQRIDELEARVTQFEAASPTTHADCGSDCSCCLPGWFATVDYLNWQVERNDLNYAILNPAGNGVPGAGQPVQSLDFGLTSGARIGLGRRTASGWEVGVRYTFLRARDSQVFAPGGNQVLAVLASPSTGLTNADAATATSAFDYDVFDLDAGHWLELSDTLSVMVFGGVRLAFLDHRVRAQYNGGAFVNGSVDVPTDVDAFGGRMGTTMSWDVIPELSFFGTTSLAVMATEINAGRREVNAGVTVIDAQRESSPVAPVVDVALGMRARFGQVTFAAGYEWTNWFNVVSPLEFTDSFNGGTLAGAERDLGLHGLFANMTYAF